MKKNIAKYMIAGLGLLATATSCSDYLDNAQRHP